MSRGTAAAKRETTAALAALLALAACAPGDGGGERAASASEPAAELAYSAPAGGAAASAGLPFETLASEVETRVDSIDRLLLRVPNLTGAEQAALRRDVNAVQTATAQRMGIRRGADPEALLESGRLVRLADTTRYWVVRDLTHSDPYVTPDTERMLHELGERFHAALDSLDLPRYRMEITSVLRSPKHQARLRRSNPNAANGVSAHEFGTTVDVAYRRFSAPAGAADDLLARAHPAQRGALLALHDSLVAENARLRGTELQAVLGRVVRQMREEGKLQVMMERQQTVYHMTVARRFPAREPVPVEPAPPPAARLAADARDADAARR